MCLTGHYLVCDVYSIRCNGSFSVAGPLSLSCGYYESTDYQMHNWSSFQTVFCLTVSLTYSEGIV